MVLSDMGWSMLAQEDRSVVYPYAGLQIRVYKGVHQISWGQSSAGYDLRLDPREILVPRPGVLLNPKWTTEERDAAYDHVLPVVDKAKWTHWADQPIKQQSYWDIPPGGSALALTVEKIVIPRDHIGICVGKSTYARCGLIVNTTPLEPEWRGHLVLELHNIQTYNPIRVYGGEGIAQLLLFKVDGAVFTSYADRYGKYQNQDEITPAKL